MAGNLSCVDFSHVEIGMFVDYCQRILGRPRAILWSGHRASVEHTLETKTEEWLGSGDCIDKGLGIA